MPENAIYCLKCGFADIKHCTKCGKERISGSLFCRSCGKRYYTPDDTAASPTIRMSAIEAEPEKPVVNDASIPDSVLPLKTDEEKVATETVISKSPFVSTESPVDEPVVETDLPSDLDEHSFETESFEDEPVSEYHSFSEPEPVATPVNQKTQPVNNEPAKKKSPLTLAIVIGVIVIIIGSFIAIYLVSTASQRKYKQAKKAFDSGNYEKAYNYFESIGDYQDSKELAEEAKLLMHYENGKKAFDSGDFTKAAEEFSAAGTCKDAEQMVRQSELAGHYSNGVSFVNSGDYSAALDEFTQAAEYKDAPDQIKKCYYQLGEAALAKNSLDDAEKYFDLASGYKDASTKIPEINYKRGEQAFNSGDLLTAAKSFNNAGNYKDAVTKAKDIYYTLAVDAYGKKDYQNAAEYFSIIGDYKDSAAYSPEAYYNGAVAFLNAKDYENAGKFLGLAGKYKNANTTLIQTIQKLVKANEFENARKMCAHYSSEDSERWGNYIEGMIAFRDKNFVTAATYFQNAGDFLNSNECYLSSNYNQGLVYLVDKKYEDARPFFVLSGKYKFSQDLVYVCDAEEKYEQGAIAQAVKLYAKVSKKAKITGFDIQGRKAIVNARLTLENVKGNWGVKANTITVKHSDSNTTPYEWRSTYPWEGQYVKVSFTQNTNGTFNITIEVTFGAYTNFSYYSYDLNRELKTVKKTYKNQKKLPTSMKLDSNTTLKYSSGTFSLAYSKYVKSGTATNQFNSSVTYKKGT